MADGQRRVWRPDWPVSVLGATGDLRRGPGDPTFRVYGDDVWRGIRSPDGPVTHADIIAQVRAAGARIQLIMDGDVAAAIHAAMEQYDATDVYIGTGGAPEAVLAAAALKCVGGQMLCRIWPRTDDERDKLQSDGVDLKRIYTVDDLVRGENVSFAATGITTGDLLRGVRFAPDGARTHSVMMRAKTGTIRYIEAIHNWKRV